MWRLGVNWAKLLLVIQLEAIHVQIVSYFRKYPDGYTINVVFGTKKLGSPLPSDYFQS